MATPKPSGLARFTRQAQGSGTSTSNDTPSTAPSRDGGPAAGTSGSGAPKPKLVGVYVMPDGHRQLKVEAAKRGATVSDLVREALNAWFANEHLPPLA